MSDNTSLPVTHFRPSIEIRYLNKTAKLQHSKKIELQTLYCNTT